MPRKGKPSTVETHPERAGIERALAIGVPLHRLAKRYDVSKDALHRHKRKIPPQLKAKLAGALIRSAEDLEKLRLEESENLLGNLAAQRARLLLAQDEAMAAEQFGLVAQIAGQIHRNAELIGKLVGEFAAHSIKTTISILVSDDYLRLRHALLRALAPYPDARRAVAAVIHDLEAEAARPPVNVTPRAAVPATINGASVEALP